LAECSDTNPPRSGADGERGETADVLAVQCIGQVLADTLGATGARDGDTELPAQRFHGGRTRLDGAADVPVSDGIADANVHCGDLDQNAKLNKNYSYFINFTAPVNPDSHEFPCHALNIGRPFC